MKKFFVSALSIAILVFGGNYVLHHSRVTPAPSIPKTIQKQTATQTVKNAQTTTIGMPKELIIPAIQVDASVESVGLDSQKRMDVPQHAMDVGWYNLGYKPGEKGSAVIDGHLDTVTGAAAVFWNLGKLQNGDSVKVVDDKDNTYTYHVTDVEKYDFDKVPLQQIFASNDKARLNLITCGGTWDQANKNYLKRTVVYTERE